MATIYDIYNEHAPAPILLVCEHASNHTPAEFSQLGLDKAALTSHMAWDVGALALAKKLSDSLAAPLLHSTVSRLVYDCNRPPEAPDAIVEQGEAYAVPGNQQLSVSARQDRIKRYYRPFQEALAGWLEHHQPHYLITVHSFTPIYFGKHREVDLGILHDADSRMAERMLACAEGKYPYVIRCNEPYAAEDGVTHTLREHAVPRGLDNVMLELKSTLLTDAEMLEQIANDLCIMLRCSLDIRNDLRQQETAGES